MTLPTTERLLLGPGPSSVSPRVMRALGAPARSHLDPDLIALMDDLRARLARVFRAGPGSLTFAVSGTGTSGMETAVANVTKPGARTLVIVTGYFGDRLAQMFERYGAQVTRLDVAWGQAVDPAAVERALAASPADIVGFVHGETSTGVRNPAADLARIAMAHGALTVVDAVTSLGAVPLDVAGWGIDVCYACSQKGLGAPSGMAPITFSANALARRVPCRSFYLDVTLLQQYWVERKYHHTISAPLVYSLHAALEEVEEEELEARWSRHAHTHRALVDGLSARGWSLLPAEADRLFSLNAVNVPAGVNDAAARVALRDLHQIEIGAGLGPLAGKIWRVGLMGSGATAANVTRLLAALDDVAKPGA
jgi:alanine-glyoxylate transaminase/serine-glyoxylate transaminase/serine-pyruvate transaminase